MFSKNQDEHRRQIIRRLENEKRELNAKDTKEQRSAAKVNAALFRAKQPAPRGDICPECWTIHNIESKLYPVPHEDVSHYDRMKCDKCGYTEDRATGMK